MSYDIFISYSSEDKIVADAVVADLEKKDIRCWYAPRDIRPGADWGDSITQAIDNCTIMLLIFSKNSNRSKRVLDEIYYAILKERRYFHSGLKTLTLAGPCFFIFLHAIGWMPMTHPGKSISTSW